MISVLADERQIEELFETLAEDRVGVLVEIASSNDVAWVEVARELVDNIIWQLNGHVGRLLGEFPQVPASSRKFSFLFAVLIKSLD